MWKFLVGMSLTVGVLVMADEPVATKPPLSSVSVECHGRLRHGVVAAGGETTGTTITFDRVIYELQLQDDAQKDFAKEHHKGKVTATGTLRRVAGTESKVRWIIDVGQLLERDDAKVKEGLRLTIQGTLRKITPDTSDTPQLTIDADGQAWPLALIADAKLQAQAESLAGQQVVLTGHLEPAPEEAPSRPAKIQIESVAKRTALPAKD